MFIRKMSPLLVGLIISVPLILDSQYEYFIPNINGITPHYKITLFNPNAQEELVIYTHESFLTWGIDPVTTRYLAFDKYAEKEGITIKLFEYSGMVDALNELIRQKNNPKADIVIGLDNVMISRAKQQKILQPYLEANLENISTSLITALDPERYLLPIDFGLIAVIFDTEFITTTNHPELEQLSFDILNSTFAETLVVQDPTLSATGINFLLYQITFYEKILGQDWKIWWDAVKDRILIDKSWTDSWSRVFSAKQAHMMVSYATDPAYNAYFNYSFEKNAAIIHHGTQQYGWMQIEGIGLVNGTKNLALAKKFVDYALSEDFQSLIALNNWMFPANHNVSLPACYSYAITTENVTILNNLITSDYIAENYLTWLNDWQQIIYGQGYWWLWVTIPSVVIFVGIVVFSVIYIRKKRIVIE